MKIERKPSTALLPTPVVLLSVAGHGKEKPDIVTLAWVGVACSTPPDAQCGAASIAPLAPSCECGA